MTSQTSRFMTILKNIAEMTTLRDRNTAQTQTRIFITEKRKHK